MKLRLLVLASIFLCSSIASAQQYVFGEFIVDTIYTGSYGSIAQCDPDPDVTLVADSSLINNVTGLSYQYIITSISAPVLYTPSHGNLNVGDTLSIHSGVSYPMYFPGGGSFTYIIRAIGIPTVANELYHCNLSSMFTLGFCNNTAIFAADTTGPQCMVGTVSVEEKESIDDLVYPNPTNGNYIYVETNSSGSYEIRDTKGNCIRIANLRSGSEMINLTGLNNGVYFLRLTGKNFLKNLVFIKN